MIVLLIVLATLPVPGAYLYSLWLDRRVSSEDRDSPDQQRELYTKCQSAELLDQDHTEQQEGPRVGPMFLPGGHELYRLLPQQEEEDTGV